MKQLVARLDRDLEAICAETEAGLARQLPTLVGQLPTDLLSAAVRGTHERAIALLRGENETPVQRARATELGRRAAQAGVSPDDVLAGYRIGADVANGRTQAVLLEIDAGTAATLAVWRWSRRFFDDLAERTLDGVRRDHARRQHRRARDQQALVEALLGGAPTAGLEAAAGWPVPSAVRVAVAGRGELEAHPGRGVVGRWDGRLVAIVGDDAGRALRAAAVGVGPAVPPAQAAASWRTACSLVALSASDAASVALADNWLVELALMGDEYARRALPDELLAPIDALPARQRAMIDATLRAWLATPGRPTVIAAALGVHPQTVQYRLRRLRSVVGDCIDDPEERFALELALRLREITAPVARPSA